MYIHFKIVPGDRPAELYILQIVLDGPHNGKQ